MTNINDRSHSSRPAAAVNKDKVKQAAVLIINDRKITIAKSLHVYLHIKDRFYKEAEYGCCPRASGTAQHR